MPLGGLVRSRYLLGDVNNISIKWRDFVAYHCSHLFWVELVDIFEHAILDSYGPELMQRVVEKDAYLIDRFGYKFSEPG